jgi:hypothetical protein
MVSQTPTFESVALSNDLLPRRCVRALTATQRCASSDSARNYTVDYSDTDASRLRLRRRL